MRRASALLAFSLSLAGCFFESSGDIIEGTQPSTGEDTSPDTAGDGSSASDGVVGADDGPAADDGSLADGSGDEGLDDGWADDGVSGGADGADGVSGDEGASDDGLADDGSDGAGDEGDFGDGADDGGSDDSSSDDGGSGDGGSEDGAGDDGSADDDGDGSDDGGNDGSGDGDGALDVPQGEHCASVAHWDPQAAQFEEEVLLLTNEARARGHNCDSNGNFGPTGPLAMNPSLRCSARLHSVYMGVTGDFNHTQSQTGLDPFQRMRDAGYAWRTAGENIAAGQRSPRDVVNGWLDSDGHCSNIMNPDYADIGIGYFMGSKNWDAQPAQTPYWTQNFGATF